MEYWIWFSKDVCKLKDVPGSFEAYLSNLDEYITKQP